MVRADPFRHPIGSRCNAGGCGRGPSRIHAARHRRGRADRDNPVRPHTEVLWELRHLAAAGLGDAGALRAATLDAARLLGLADDRGEIAVGKRADLVVLQGDDLDCGSLETRIQRVFHNGVEVGR
ncbi:hypothetical protein E0H50_15995 [Kribbella sindirgiensis]|uniref:Amidohydrolase-related domain-containing protein n=1 Tax=Kribbella sindirgiensis TaxID=1124744 RepID=A0A4R0IYA5_9ACTN|nr:hypothetical protein E0H50_15995 [Kribbella sindirgiensis]